MTASLDYRCSDAALAERSVIAALPTLQPAVERLKRCRLDTFDRRLALAGWFLLADQLDSLASRI